MNSPQDSPVRLMRDGAVAELVLDRPAAANALSSRLLEALGEQLDALADCAEVRVVILSAVGQVFCAGMDLKEARAASPAEVRHLAGRLAGVATKLREFRTPVIAKVRGMASAAGLELVLACDLAYAASTARFATPGLNVGMWCMTPMVPLVRTVAIRHAAEMLMRAEPIDAERAERIGLINRSFDEAELDERVARIAGELAAKSPFTLELGKRALLEQRGLTIAEGYARAVANVEVNALHPDAQEGMSAFAQKRPPKWTS